MSKSLGQFHTCSIGKSYFICGWHNSFSYRGYTIAYSNKKSVTEIPVTEGYRMDKKIYEGA